MGKHGGGSIICTGVLLKQQLKTPDRPGHNSAIQQDNGPKHTSKIATKLFQDNKVKAFGVAITEPWPEAEYLWTVH